LDNQNDGRPEPKEAEEMTVILECKVCLSQIVDTVLIPCGHAVLCRWCANQHMPSSRADHTRPKKPATCPMCRKPVKQKVSIFWWMYLCIQVSSVNKFLVPNLPFLDYPHQIHRRCMRKLRIHLQPLFHALYLPHSAFF
jgi:antibiotic biosynthesis monooxygenase (ABM) superfamily enzyme